MVPEPAAAARLRQARARWRAVRERISPPYQQELERAIGDAESVLDVGCGASSPLGAFSRKFARCVGVDAYEPALEQSRAAGIHTETRALDALGIRDAFGPSSFDVVVAVDVLEHLGEDDALRLLEQMERVARRRVVVFTPNGFLQQGAADGNPWQVHRSGWTAARLRELGYDVRGVHGLRWLRGEYAAIRPRPERVWHLVSDLTQPLARRVPELAFHLLAVKTVAAQPAEETVRA